MMRTTCVLLLALLLSRSAVVTQAYNLSIRIQPGRASGGNPFGTPKAVTSDGVSDNVDGTPASGYSVVNAKDQDEATELAKGCPMLADSPGASVDVYEAFPM